MTAVDSRTKHVQRLELVIPRPAFDAAMRRLLLDTESCAVGSFRWRRTDEAAELLVDRLEILPELMQGASRPPLDSYLVLFVEYAEQGWTARELLARVTPRASQQATGLVIYPGRLARWDAAVKLGDQEMAAVDAVRIAGPAPLVLSRGDPDESNTEDAGEKWSRTAGAVGPETFARLRRLRVNLIGTGRNGALCAQQLAALGVAQLRLIDADRLEHHNLLGTIGLDAADVGMHKAQAVAKSLLRLRPELALSCIQRSVYEPDALAELRRRSADFIVTCVDDDGARLAAWLLARETLVPHLDIASAVLGGDGRLERLADVRLFVPGPGQGCPACVGGVGDLAETLYTLNAPPGSMRRGAAITWAYQRAGSLVALNSLAVGAGLNLLIDYLAGSLYTSAWQRLRWSAGEGLVGGFAAVGSAENCTFCGRLRFYSRAHGTFASK